MTGHEPPRGGPAPTDPRSGKVGIRPRSVTLVLSSESIEQALQSGCERRTIELKHRDPQTTAKGAIVDMNGRSK
jgi:hypothetical protein